MDSPRSPGWPASEPVLSRFRRWLDETRDEIERLDDEPPIDAAEDADVGLLQLVERLTALRHEIKLLTKTARGREERDEAAIVAMQAAIEQFRSVQANEAEVADRAARPLVESLIELDEALVRGRQVIETARRRWIAAAETHLAESRERLERLYQQQSWWRRRLCRPWHDAVLALYSEQTTTPQREIFDALLEGYQLIQNRLQRTFDKEEICRMQSVGRQLDPHAMTVIEAIRQPGQPPGLVIEEVRPGYYWKGKVLRFAEVKVAGER